MSTETIFGGWDTHPTHAGDEPAGLWHKLAAQNIGTPQQQNNLGLTQRRSEITLLWELFLRQKPSVVVEIGVAQGGTFAGWCQLARDNATIIGIDRCLDDSRPRPGDPCPAIYSGPLKMFSQGGGINHVRQGHQTVIGINGWSYEPAVIQQLEKALAGRKIEFLFHDASHESEMFLADFQIYWPMIADGGIFASHDINWSEDPKCNKSVAWDRIKRVTDYSAVYEFLPHSKTSEMGIGVLIK